MEYNKEIIVGGQFSEIGGVEANSIARWDEGDQDWKPLGGGILGIVHCMKIIHEGGDDLLYVGGTFTYAGGYEADDVAMWDGDTWTTVGDGTDATVHAIEKFQGDLYIGGSFSAGLARLDGGEWQEFSLGWGITSVNCMAVYPSEDDPPPNVDPVLYFGGAFTVSQHLECMASYNGMAVSVFTDLRTCGISLNNNATCLLVADIGDGPQLFAGGGFSTGESPSCLLRSGVLVLNEARTGWDSVGQDEWAGVNCLATTNPSGEGTLYAGGSTLPITESGLGGLVYCNGSTWSEVGEDSPSGVNGMVFHHCTGQLWVGGAFESAGSTNSSGVAVWGKCVADFYCDTFVDFFDDAAWTECFEGTACPEGRTADLNCDEFVDFFDAALWSAYFERGC